MLCHKGLWSSCRARWPCLVWPDRLDCCGLCVRDRSRAIRRVGMPSRMRRICAHPGCNALVVARGKCELHQQDYHEQEYRQWYRTKRWSIIRQRQLLLYPWCAEHWRAGSMVPATDVDHVVPHNGNPQLFWGGVLESLCHSCHSRKTMSETIGREP